MQAPLQPLKVEPVVAAAVRVTDTPETNGAEHCEPQLIGNGFDVTVPEPGPAFVTVRTKERANLAVTLRAAVIDTVHVGAEPEHAPVHPVNADPAPAAAVSVTAVDDAFSVTVIAGHLAR